MPTKALEIKTIKKHLIITQCRFFNCFPPVCGIPNDTPKLFLGGFVRKDIQYSEPTRQTATTVEGTIKDFVIDLPFTCVVDLGNIHTPTLFSQRQEYEFSSSTSLPSGFSPKDKLLSGDLTEFNLVSQQFLNTLPNCELIYSQINEMDDPLDRVPLLGGPLDEGVFRTVQEKMIVLIQLRLTFPTEINPPHPHCHFPEPKCNDHPPSNACCHHNPFLLVIAKLLECILRGMTH
ncbi:CsxC family protein [Desulfosporosinus fructosivorans]